MQSLYSILSVVLGRDLLHKVCFIVCTPFFAHGLVLAIGVRVEQQVGSSLVFRNLHEILQVLKKSEKIHTDQRRT